MASKEVNERIKASKNKHELHVLFLMDKENLSKANATTLAYLQGYGALGALLGRDVHNVDTAQTSGVIRDVLDPEMDKAQTEAAFKAAGGKLGPVVKP